MKWSLFKLIILLTLSLAGTNLGAQPSKVDSLAGLLSGQEGEYLARTYLELARAWNYKDPAKMIDYAGKALAITHETGNLKQACYANLLLGSGNLLLGKFDESKPYIDLGLEQARKLNFPEYLCIGFNSLAAYYMNGGNYDLAFELFHEALNMAESANLPEMAANSRLNLGSILTSRGDRTDGLKYLLQALEYYESTGEQRMISRIYNNIAVNYHSWKDYDLALHYYARTLVSYEKQQDFVGLAVVSNNIGEIYKDKEEYAQAIRYYQRTIQLADSTGIGEFYKSYGWIGLAETYLLMGEYDLSLKNVTLALGVFGRTKMKEGIALSHLILSRIYLYKKDYPKSLQAADSAIQVGGAIGIPGIVGKAYQVKASVYADQKRYQEAFDMLNFALRKRDTLYKEEQVRELARLRGELDVTGKNKEIQLLLKDNEIKDLSLKKQRAQTRYLVLLIGLLSAIFIIMLINIRSNRRTRFLLQEKSQRINEQRLELIRVNATKDKFLSIIGHDLRNPVGAFKDVVGQLADFPEMFPEEMRQQIIRELRDEAERTYFLLENLLSWAKNQKNNIRYHPEKLDLASLVDNNILLHARSAERKHIRLRSSVLPGVAVYADHNMVNLILRNLISNAIKFTGENGEITVSSKDKEDFIEVSLADSGVGIPKEKIPALFEEINSVSTYGTNHEKGSGIGLILCREFIEMNGGTITVRSKVNMGTTLTFTLKKHKTPVFAEP